MASSLADSLSVLTWSDIEPICNDSAFLLVHLSISSLCGICGSVIIWNGMSKLICGDSSILLQFRCLFGFCSFTFILQLICSLLIVASCSVHSLSPFLIFAYFGSVFCYNVQLITLLLLLLMRLYFTFRGSVHAIDNSRHSLRIIKLSFAALGIVQLLSSILDILSPLNLCAYTGYLLISCILVFVFVLKLQTLTVHTSRTMYDHSKMEMSMNSRRDSHVPSLPHRHSAHTLPLPLPLPIFTPNNSVIRNGKDEENEEDIIVPPPTVDNIEHIPQHRRTLSFVICSKLKTSQQQKFLVDSTAKYVCLNCLTVSSTMLTFVIVTLCGYFAERWRCSIALPMFQLDGFINLLCLWLTYKTSNRYYTKYCSRMDSLCKSALVKVTSFRMIKLYGKQTANKHHKPQPQQLSKKGDTPQSGNADEFEGHDTKKACTRQHRVYTNSSVALPETNTLPNAGNVDTQNATMPPAVTVISASNSSANTNTTTNVNASAVEVVISVDEQMIMNDELRSDINNDREKHSQYLHAMNHLHIVHANSNNASNGITPFMTRSPTQSSRTSRSSSIDVVYEEPVELHQDFVPNTLPDAHIKVEHDSNKPRDHQTLKHVELQLALTEKLKHLSQNVNDSNLDQ